MADYRRPIRPEQKNLLYIVVLLGSGALFGAVGGILLFLFATGGLASSVQSIQASISLSGNENSDDDLDEASSESTPLVLLDSAESDNAITEASSPASDTPSRQLFRIDTNRSQARFSVYETFPEGTAIGRTREVAGDIIVDHQTPANSQIGIIRVNLRALRTNDSARDRSIRCCVLLTARDEFEFSEFTPTAISSLPPEVSIGDEVMFQMTGDLRVRGSTRPVTFDVELSLVSSEEIRGLATATVDRRDFGILNNSENSFDYHGVTNEITLEFEFLARSVTE